MGGLTSMQRSNVQELDISASAAYRYPPKTGCYFGSYFSMGGQRFDTPQPEAYLFGENSDLNYLSSRPAPFPYPHLQPSEPTKTLKSLVNIRKDSLKLIKAVREGEETEDGHYSIEFTFDTEARTAFTIHFFAREEIQTGHAIYTARDPTLRSETFHYERGSSQTFYQPAFTFDPSIFEEDEFTYIPGKDVIPIVIQGIVEEGEEHAGHSHALFATLEQTMESTYVIKTLKQKQMVDGVYYMLQEIFGIENKNSGESGKTVEEDEFADDIGSDCVICMSDARDTLILPCRHLCLCSTCADSLRYQASCCPICRAPFRALLQIRALRKIGTTVPTPNDDEEHQANQENVPSGYEAVPLGEALNGPSPTRASADGGAGERLLGSASSEGRSRRGRRKARSSSAASLRSRTSEEQTTGFREENETKKSAMANGSVRSLPESKKAAKAQAVVTSGDVVELFQDDNKPAMPPLALRETPPSSASADSKSGRSTASPQSVALEGSLMSADSRPQSAGKGSLKSNRSREGSQKSVDTKTVDRLVVHGLQETAIDDPESNPAMGVMYDETEEPQMAELSHNSASLSYTMDLELPGTPQSNPNELGNRDSQASYSSTGSTRQLLSTPSNIQLEETHEQMV
ncbi:probable E3 ubiquitin-protein ligase MGRN1 [Patiria miniata]|uniref:RING-type E3 ubiquitin transferase n=1 Tax=Patiria miniata TaxID=46514 RepID=A0A914AXB4_PATMI|nr:probable E3 ubiquitin-protein ligase MGRN1 [Patiria miniata]